MRLLGGSAKLDKHLSGRDNHLNLIRMLAAMAVLVSHAFPITLGARAAEPLEELTGMSLGAHAVAVFFILSGLLIARSFDRGTSHARFLVARVLRLFPALFLVLVLTVLAGAVLSELSPGAYFTAAGTLTYIPRNLSLAFLQYPLPGVFADNPVGPAINGSLWTLFYEVVCYGAVFAIGLAGLLRKRALFTALFAAIALAYVLSLSSAPEGGIAYRLDKLAQLGFPFALGTLAYVWRERVVLDLRIAALLWLLPVASAGTMLMPLVVTLAVGYSLLCLGLAVKGPLLAYNRLGDYSYGVYIYAYPLQQAAVHLFPGMSPLENMLAAAPVALVLAALSWHLIEERALTGVQPVARRIESLLRGSGAGAMLEPTKSDRA